MPDDRHPRGTGSHAQDEPRSRRHAAPERGRRRSMDTHGGIPVDEVLKKATGRHSIPEPGKQYEAPEPPPSPPPRRALPEPPEHPSSSGLPRPPLPPRNRTSPPEDPPTQRSQPVAAPAPAGPPRRAPRRRMPPGPPAASAPPAAQTPAPPAPPRPPTAAPAPRRPARPSRPAPEAPPARAPQPPVEARTTVTPPVEPPTAVTPPVAPPAKPPRPKRPAQPSAAAPKPPADGEQRGRAAKPVRLPERPKPSAEDRLIMTDQMEPVDDATMYRRKIDNTLARFSAAHDEMEAEEAKRRERRGRLAAGPGKLIEQTRTALQRTPKAEDGPKRRGRPQAHPLAHLQDKDEDPVQDQKNDEAEPLEAEIVEKEAAENAEAAPPPRFPVKKVLQGTRSQKAGRITAIAMAAVVFLVCATGWGMKTWFNSKFTEILALDENSQDIQNAAGQNGDENFLIAGSDTRAGAAAEEGVGTADDIGGARSDSLMIAHIPADRKRAVVVGFPRDLEVTRPECQRWNSDTGEYTDEKVPAKPRAKLNEAYAIGGPACTTKLIQQLTGMKINHFVGIDFHGFKDMIDVVGGVPVNVEKPVVDSVLGVVIPNAGDQVISGDQALNFVRARHVNGDPTSDYGRIKRQQLVIGSLLKKTMSKEVLFDGGKLSGFVSAFAAATFGDNIGVDQMLTLAQSMQGLDASTVQFITVPTTEEANARGNEELSQAKSKALFEALIENRPLPDPKAPAAPPKTPPSGTRGQGEAGGQAAEGDR